MKKIIGGKRYDTETAELIAEWSNDYFLNDFHYCEESLYRTRKGAWFIVGNGNAMSKYRTSLGSSGWTGKRNVFTVLSATEAREWLEEYGEPEAIEKFFVVEEG